jgi:hypothetical protein
MGLHLSRALRAAPWILAAAIAIVAILNLLVGVPAADDFGSWR